MTPAMLADIKTWLDLLESGGIIFVLLAIIVMFFRGDLLSKKTVEEMIHVIVEQTVSQTVAKIKEDIAREIGDKVVERIALEMKAQPRVGGRW